MVLAGPANVASPGPRRGGMLRRLATCAFVALCLSTIWLSLGDHPLRGRSEGRYAAVSMAMADGGSWLIPHYLGRPHLTKPPLTYWLEAACLRAVGHGELAVRLPSALAGSLTLLALLALAWRIGGRTLALLSAGVLSLMPLHVMISRLTLTDALFSLFWWCTLVGGHQAVQEPGRRRWPALTWMGVTLGLLTKGPVAWLPVLVLFTWLGLGRRWYQVRALRPLAGLVLSAAPLAAWAGAAFWSRGDVVALWYRELVDRMAGSGDHPQPLWYFVPVFLVGLFPATAMLSLPGLNYTWRSAWESLRRADPPCLWAIAVVLPFVIFSASSGKLASYLLPLAAPLALLAAMTLQRAVATPSAAPPAGGRPPEVALTLLVCAVAGTAVSFALAARFFDWASWRMAAPLLALVGAAAWLWRAWRKAPAQRRWALGAVWLAGIACWWAGAELEDQLTELEGGREAIARLHEQLGTRDISVVTFGHEDGSLSFYHRQPVPRVRTAPELADLLARTGDGLLVVLADPEDWAAFGRRHPDLSAHFRAMPRWVRPGLPRSRWLALLPDQVAAPPPAEAR